MRIVNPIVYVLGLTSVAFAASGGFNLRQAASGLISNGGKVIESGIATTNKIVADYGPSIAQGAGELSEGAKNGASNAAKWSIQNPVLATCAVTGAAGVVLIAAPGVVAAPLLTGAGFTASGVQAASVGAAVQAGIGNVAAGSSFAILQGAGAGSAAALGTVNGIVQLSGAAMTATSGAIGYLRSKL